MSHWTRLEKAAWFAILLHIFAGLAMLFILRHGLGTNQDILDRVAFLSHQRPLWIGAWFVWNLAALSIVAFYVAFAVAHWGDGRSSPVALALSVVLGGAAMAADLGAEAIEMGVLPGMAPTMSQATFPLFLTLDRIAVMLTGYVANSLYTIAAMILAWSTRHAYPRWVWLAGLGVGGAGLALSAAALTDSIAGMFLTNAVLIPVINAWLIGVAWTAGRKGHGQG